MKKFRIGCDPELFLQDATGGLMSAIDLIGGTKEDPRPLVALGEGFGVQEDNVALEFNIPAAETREQLRQHIQNVLQHLQEEIQPMNLTFSMLSAANFPANMLAHPKAMVFGCDPDFNAWDDGRRNPRPKADDHSLRSAGGHVHVGYEFQKPQDILTFIKLCDLCLAVPSVIMDVDGGKRRLLYGKPGAFRVKPYGAEYRTLSNFWVARRDPRLIEWVWDATSQAIQFLESGVNPDNYRNEILEAVNNNNAWAAEQLIRTHNLITVQ